MVMSRGVEGVIVECEERRGLGRDLERDVVLTELGLEEVMVRLSTSDTTFSMALQVATVFFTSKHNTLALTIVCGRSWSNVEASRQLA